MKLFGTDGIRGRANQWPMIPSVMVQIGRAVARYFLHNRLVPPSDQPKHKYFNPYVDDANHQFTVVVGKDTRLSGYMIESALVSGLLSEGANVIMLGPIPTPAIAMLSRSLRADVGIMISASHNPYYDNGIKLFDSNGIKFAKSVEESIEEIADAPIDCEKLDCGKSMRLDDAAGRYVEFAKSTFPADLTLSGLKIALDCANGAAYKVAPRVFWELGASVVTLGDEPNGRNINDHCGALYPDSVCRCVREVGADIGIALDGDADRLLIVTPKGQLVNGDQILALIASGNNRPSLKNGVVATSMSNLGLKKYLQLLNIPYFESDVGDKNVFALMQQKQSNLGGEESGHIILSDYTTTGDGIIAALQVLSVVKMNALDDVFPIFAPCCQVTKNFALNEMVTDSFVQDLQCEVVHALGENGGTVIRKSGTEQLLRVMIQHQENNRIMEIFETVVQPRLLAVCD
jgi:phosphoglucosamine mutase